MQHCSYSFHGLRIFLEILFSSFPFPSLALTNLVTCLPIGCSRLPRSSFGDRPGTYRLAGFRRAWVALVPTSPKRATTFANAPGLSEGFVSRSRDPITHGRRERQVDFTAAERQEWRASISTFKHSPRSSRSAADPQAPEDQSFPPRFASSSCATWRSLHTFKYDRH